LSRWQDGYGVVFVAGYKVSELYVCRGTMLLRGWNYGFYCYFINSSGGVL